MTADPADLAARMLEAAARALLSNDTGGHEPDEINRLTGRPVWLAWEPDARAVLAAAAREAGLDAEDLRDVAAYIQGVVRARREYERRHESTPCEVAVTTTIDRTAALLRALGGIADA